MLLSFLKPSNTPVYGWTALFIHSSVDGHLGLFPTLDYCEQCSRELERLAFPSKVLSPLNPRHHSHGATFMLQWQSWRVVSESVWPKICTIWLFTEKICWLLSEWIWELGHLGETASFFFFLLNMYFLLLVDNVLISAVQQSDSIIHTYVFFFFKYSVHNGLSCYVCVSCSVVSMWPHVTPWTVACQASPGMRFPGKNTE